MRYDSSEPRRGWSNGQALMVFGTGVLLGGIFAKKYFTCAGLAESALDQAKRQSEETIARFKKGLENVRFNFRFQPPAQTQSTAS